MRKSNKKEWKTKRMKFDEKEQDKIFFMFEKLLDFPHFN